MVRQQEWRERYPEHTFRGAAARGSVVGFMRVEAMCKDAERAEAHMLEALRRGPSILFRRTPP